jgi:arylsulfatase A
MPVKPVRTLRPLLAVVGIAATIIMVRAAEPQLPNIVVLFADDMGYGEVHGLNPERGKVPTPNLDKLIKDGMVFTDAHTASSI